MTLAEILLAEIPAEARQLGGLELAEKRYNAIKALNLNDRDGCNLANELAALEWPTDLEHVNPGAMPVIWSIKDQRSLLCIRRYSRASIPVIWENFFPSRSAVHTIRQKWLFMMREVYPNWTREDDRKLMRLYNEGKTFDSMASEDFQGRFLLDLEILVGQNGEFNKSKTKRTQD